MENKNKKIDDYILKLKKGNIKKYDLTSVFDEISHLSFDEFKKNVLNLLEAFSNIEDKKILKKVSIGEIIDKCNLKIQENENPNDEAKYKIFLQEVLKRIFKVFGNFCTLNEIKKILDYHEQVQGESQEEIVDIIKDFILSNEKNKNLYEIFFYLYRKESANRRISDIEFTRSMNLINKLRITLEFEEYEKRLKFRYWLFKMKKIKKLISILEESKKYD